MSVMNVDRLSALLLVFCLAAIQAGCGKAGTEPRDFRHDVSLIKPWTHENFDAAPNKFTFAIFSDLLT